jgi:hypothetical protein
MTKQNLLRKAFIYRTKVTPLKIQVYFHIKRERSNSYLLKIKRYETHIFKDMNNYKQDPP